MLGPAISMLRLVSGWLSGVIKAPLALADESAEEAQFAFQRAVFIKRGEMLPAFGDKGLQVCRWNFACQLAA